MTLRERLRALLHLHDPANAPPQGPDVMWGWPKRLLFRFLFAGLVIYIFPFPLGYLPGMSWVRWPYDKAIDGVALWIGRRYFGLTEFSQEPTGSGDTLHDWLWHLSALLFALAVTFVWSIVDRRRKAYPRLHQGLRTYVRYSLATAMLSYGLIKVFGGQMPPPWGRTLIETYGVSSPMRLAWTFFGFSAVYRAFAGLSEAIGGLLLFSARTTPLGALLLCPVLINVVMVNFCFDVPVKIYSSMLLFEAVYLATPELAPLVRLLLRRQPTQVWAPHPLFTRKWMVRASWILRLALLAVSVYRPAKMGMSQAQEFAKARAQEGVLGLWSVEEFSRKGELAPPLTTDKTRWSQALIRQNSLTLEMMDSSMPVWKLEIEEPTKTLTVTAFDDEAKVFKVTYQLPDADHLVIDGTFAGNPISVHLKRVDMSKLPLLSRGFHWVSPFPFNR